MISATCPSKHLLEGCNYTPAAATNVELTWRRFGWLPMQERKAKPKHKVQLVQRIKVWESASAGA